MKGNGATNGAVLLGSREMRLRITPKHATSLEALARRHGYSGPTECAEALLQDAIERAARNTAMKHILGIISSLCANARWE